MMGRHARLARIAMLSILVVAGGCAPAATPSSAPSARPSPPAAADPDATLGGLDQPVPPPSHPIPLTSSVFEDSQTMDEFLGRVLIANDEFWSSLFTLNGLPEPFVNYRWPAVGEVVFTACVDSAGNRATDDSTASYCGADDTIYVSQKFAFDAWNGLLQAHGPAPDVQPSDFGVAYIVAHEFGHSIQNELGLYPRGATVKNHELQADCLAGIWAAWAYSQQQLDETDAAEAIETAEWIGDYQYSEPSHHGTPTERSTAWTAGFTTGAPEACAGYNAPS